MEHRIHLLKAGYSVQAKKTGAEYPRFAPSLGPEWEFILTSPDGRERGFTNHGMAWAFAQRLASQVPA